MNYRKLLGFVITISITCVVHAQQLEWQFAPKDTITGNCTSMTSCKEDKVCYFLKYTPSYTGTLTSYTLGFFSNCTSNTNPIFNALSCTMTDNTTIDDYCSVFGSFLFKVKGNDGNIPVTAGVPLLIHEVCFDMGDDDTYNIEDDQVTGFTAAIDSIGSGNPKTDFMNYQSTQLTNEKCLCFRPALDSGDPNPTIICLEDFDEIKYDLLNCDNAFVTGLPSGLASTYPQGQIAFDGIPDEAGMFTYTIGSITCDCKNATGTIQVDSSAIVIDNNCYETMADAMSEFQGGDVIEIIRDVVSPPGLILNPGIEVVVRKNVNWRIRRN